jgi:hypothetical protein
VTDEAVFYRRFVDDVRRCAAGRAPSAVAEIEHRVRVAMIAPPAQRERRWALVVAAVNELLAGVAAAADDAAAARLRTFARENADLGRPRDVAITDFRLDARPEGTLIGRDGRTYLVFAAATSALRHRPPAPALDEVVPAPARRLAEWSVFGICTAAAAAAVWFAFFVPV